jgi:RHS repeat-associated protein
MSHSNPTAGVHRVFLGLLALGFSATSVLAQSTADIYFIHPDHLNTPRVITNNVNQVVWRWDNLDPFGANLPNENPSGLGNFTCNLRLPGQYFDRETKLHYNYFRDYDPGIGRYIESDPIGLAGGLNTYAYVSNNPLAIIDPLGLESCTGEWRRYKWVRGTPFTPGFGTPNPGKPTPQVRTFPALTCNCHWLCQDCKNPSIFSPDGTGLPQTPGRIFFDPSTGPKNRDGNVESGNNCLCSPPGPQTGCGCPK